MWSYIWSLSTNWIGFRTWIWSTRHRTVMNFNEHTFPRFNVAANFFPYFLWYFKGPLFDISRTLMFSVLPLVPDAFNFVQLRIFRSLFHHQLMYRRVAQWVSAEADLGLLPAANCYHKVLHLGCCSSPRSASAVCCNEMAWLSITFWPSSTKQGLVLLLVKIISIYKWMLMTCPWRTAS